MDLDDYYNLDFILAEQTRIPCIALQDFDERANLTGDKTKVKKNSKIEMPFWMAKPLGIFVAREHETLLTMLLPRMYGTKMRNALAAGASSVDLRSICPYYYIFACQVLGALEDEQLPDILEKAFLIRLRDIMDFSKTEGSTLGHEFVRKLDETEMGLFRVGKASAAQARRWEERNINSINAFDLKARRQ
ncbi:hypothetical protein BDF20DRAFT_845675 [Mycotypha africana]|uniref:uncharacterized protein n=1 Tax=Mycotypha africana TaxID=64632 RepID=UPI0023018847|nr:uncharacterized protein BDF20DRAFT_845675 [Mycotypha africana]KAI8991644.1 hypothetical protein BDF20DRAFT_845675 [Mycotypha africana]